MSSTSQYYSNTKDWYHSKYGKALQKLRRSVTEEIIGQAKAYHGMARDKFRGINKVEIQILYFSIFHHALVFSLLF